VPETEIDIDIDDIVRTAARRAGAGEGVDVLPVPDDADERVRAWSAADGVFVLVSSTGAIVSRSLPLPYRAVFREIEPEPGRLWGATVSVEPGTVTVVQAIADGNYPTPALLGAHGSVDADGTVTAARGVPGATADVVVRDESGDDHHPGVIVFEPDGITTLIGPWATTVGAYSYLPIVSGDVDVVADWVPGEALVRRVGTRVLRVLVEVPGNRLAGVLVDGIEQATTPVRCGVSFDVTVDEPSRPIRVELHLRGVSAGEVGGAYVVDVPRRTTDRFRGPLDVRGSAWLETAVTMPMAWEVVPGVSIADVIEFHARPPGPAGATFQPAVVYGTAGTGGRPLTLDLYRRTDATEKAPVVLFFHGGGWGGGDPWFHIRHAHALAAAGYVTAVVRYRLFPEAMWPAAIEDVTCAVRWARAVADEIGADPDRVAVAGGSAGGQLAAMVALRPGAHEGTGGHAGERSDVQAAVLWYPATDLTVVEPNADLQPIFDTYFGQPPADGLRDASPVTWVHADCPPILTITGSADQLTTRGQIEAFHRQLDAASVTNRVEVFEGRDHAFDLHGADDWHRSYALAAAFLDEHLRHVPATAG